MAKSNLIDDLVKDRFGTHAALELCRGALFKPGELYRRDVIATTLRDEFVKHGGNDETTKNDVAVALKKWLSGSDSPFKREMRGQYRFLGFGATGGEVDVEERGGSGGNAGGELAPAAEREIGTGRCEVYAWCLPRYQATSGDRWPIKIGMAGTDGFERRLREFQENLPERPRYLLRLRCTDERIARKREALIHAWFESRGQKLEELPGEEWFETNPTEIDEAIRNIIPIDPPGHAGKREIEEIIADAFKGVPAEDWARLPEDLVERLDHYLYGSENP